MPQNTKAQALPRKPTGAWTVDDGASSILIEARHVDVAQVWQMLNVNDAAVQLLLLMARKRPAC